MRVLTIRLMIYTAHVYVETCRDYAAYRIGRGMARFFDPLSTRIIFRIQHLAHKILFKHTTKLLYCLSRMGLLARITGVAVASTASPALGWVWYTRATQVVPFPTSSPDFSSAISRKFNPGSNPPVCSDMAIRTVPLEQLKTTDQESLTRQFCQGVWAGPGFEIQRRYLQRKYRALEGREDHLWEKKDLKSSPYDVGTKIVDHFEVVERTPEKVRSFS